MIQQTDVDAVLQRGRDFYKHGYKTTFKFYPFPVSVLPKHLRRAQSVTPEAEVLIDRQREELDTDEFVNYGEKLYRRNLTHGDCLEMAAVTAWLCKTSIELAPKVRWHVGASNSDPNRNHIFNIVVDHTATWPPQFRRIADIESVASSTGGIWAIDLWAKTACPIAEYPRRFREKADTWVKQNKYIDYGSGECTAREFVDFVAMDVLEFWLAMG
jgi:hypothetical protein